MPCISLDTLDSGSYPRASCHIAIPVPIHSDIGLSTFPAVSVEKRVLTVGAMSALAPRAVGITLVAIWADHSPVSIAHLASLTTHAVPVSCSGADPIFDIPQNIPPAHFASPDSTLARDPEIGFDRIPLPASTIS